MPIPQMTNELVEELGFIYSKDKYAPIVFELTFAEFLEKVVAPNKSEMEILCDAYKLERIITFYIHSVKALRELTFEQFIKKVRDGTWELRFTA